MSKRMISARLDPRVVDAADARAAEAGQTRTDWIAGVVARAALTAAGRPQNPQPPVDGPS